MLYSFHFVYEAAPEKLASLRNHSILLTLRCTLDPGLVTSASPASNSGHCLQCFSGCHR